MHGFTRKITKSEKTPKGKENGYLQRSMPPDGIAYGRSRAMGEGNGREEGKSLLSIILEFPIPFVGIVRIPWVEVLFGRCQGYAFVGLFCGILSCCPYGDGH